MDIVYRRDNFDKFVKKLLPHIDPSNSLQFDTLESDGDAAVHAEQIESSGSESEESHEAINEHTNGINLDEFEKYDSSTVDELYSESGSTEKIGRTNSNNIAKSLTISCDQKEEDESCTVEGFHICISG